MPPAGRRLSANQVLAIAERLPKVQAARAEYRGSYGGAYLKPGFHWQVSYFSKDGKKEIAQVQIDDLSGRVLEQWTGFQVAWTMARGYPGAFGRHVNALYVWLPLCVLFFFGVLQLPPAVLAAAPRPAGAALLLGLARALQPRPHLRVGPARLPAAALSAGADARADAKAAPGVRRRRTAAAPARPGAGARDRRRLPDRLPRGAQRHRLERRRRRLRGRDRSRAHRRRQAAVRRLAERQRTRRHLRPGQLRGLRALRADLRLERDLGRPARRPRGGDLLRPALGRVAVPDRAPHARADARDRARLRVGLLPVHPVRAREQQQRHARRCARPRGAAGGHATARRSPSESAARWRRSRG